MRRISAVSARRRLGAVIGVILLACALGVVAGMVAGRSIPLPGAVVPTAPGSGSPPRGSTMAALSGGNGPMLLLAGRHAFAAPALGPGASWELSRASDGDEGKVADEAIGATVTFDLPAVDGDATTYTVRARSGTVTDTRRVTVFPPDTVIRLGGVGAPDLRTYTVVPSTLSPATHVLLVLHGVGRDAEEYCASWVDWASAADYLVLCPEFDEDDWPGAAGYNLGNVFSDEGEMNPEEQWAFTVAEEVHRFAASGFGLDDTLFDMWGHSAGAQFVQRFVLFKPRSAVRFAIAANAGWYTTLDPTIDFPYGVRHPEVDIAPSATREHLVLMRGQLDTERDGSLRDNRKADAQGLHRYARAGHAHAVALARDPETNWQLLDVPGADHDQQLMAPAAQRFLLGTDGMLPRTCPLPDADPCS